MSLPPQMDLLHTKLHPPPVREKQVARQHLLERLDAALSQRLTLVCAPAGYGKTTLLSQWLKRRSEPVGWVSLDRSDNDQVQFLRYFLAALQRIEANVGVQTQETLQAPRPLPGMASWLLLINDVAASDKEFVVILDDYHLVEAQEVHESLDYLIQHMPNNMHLILASRADPPLPLPRLRARGQLSELRLSDLRFSADETADFLNNVMNLDLSGQDLASLESRTEGWIASLQMAAIALRSRPKGNQTHLSRLVDSSGHPARSEFIQSFTGSHRFILDYLVEEVLNNQSPDLQDFLLKTSILERLSGSLCDALLSKAAWEQATTGYDDEVISPAPSKPASPAQEILEHLESTNLFILPLDDERLWYRYHRLFADLLHKRLCQMSPDLVPGLHLRASHWYEQQGYFDEAIQHALAAKFYDRAADLIEEHLEETLMRSEVRTFLDWMERLPNEHVCTRPGLSFYHAWALLISGQSLEGIERRLQSIASFQGVDESSEHGGWPPAKTGFMTGRMAALRAYLMLFQGDIPLAAKLCQQALENLPESDLFLRSIVTWILSMISLSSMEQEDGRQSLDKIVRVSQEMGNPLIAVSSLAHRARLQMRQGRLQLARETLEQALELATNAHGRQLPIASEALIVLGDLEREWNHLDEAAQYLTESIELAKQWNELASFDAYYPLMRLRLAQGDVAAARKAIETAWQMANRSDISQIDDILADLQRANFHVMQGDAAEAMRWAEEHGLVPGITPAQPPALDHRQEYIDAHLGKYENLVLARAYILQGRTVEALELLETLSVQARQLKRTDLTIEIHILKALALQLEGDGFQAVEALAEALSLAEPGGYMRIFLDEGEPIARLLRQAASRGVAPAYVAKLMAAFSQPSSSKAEAGAAVSRTQPLIEPLSERELQVLRLLAAGLSNPEIASELYVAVSTIHTHCKNIYEKLGVHRRWEAVHQAQELGLI